MKTFIIIATLLVLAALPHDAGAVDRIEVYADSTLYGVPGYLTAFETTGNPTDTYFLVEDAGRVLVFAFRYGGTQDWLGMPLGTCLVPPVDSGLGTSWSFLPDAIRGLQTATIENFVARTVPAGAFTTASCGVRLDSDPSVMTGYFSLARDVGIVRILDTIYGEESVLTGYNIAGGTGYLPLAAGNWWEYSVTYVSPVTDSGALVHRLESCVPNPFNPVTRISFRLAAPGRAKLAVYDLAGRQVAALVDGYLEAGNHRSIWDGRDDTGRPVSSGVYLYRLEAAGFTETKRMVLLK